MTGTQVVITALESTKQTLEMLLSDFSDADLLVRPVPEANHAAWQLGNVIAGDIFLVKAELPETPFPALPEGFSELHGTKGAKLDQSPGFLTKEGYFALLNSVRSAAIMAVSKLTDAELGRPSSEGMSFAGPTLAHVLLFIANHTIQHAGQFVVIRRKLGKPVLF